MAPLRIFLAILSLPLLASTRSETASASAARSPSDHPVIEVVGDSILFGVGLGDGPEEKTPESAFPALLAGRLEALVTLQGWPGAMAGQIADIYPEASPHQAEDAYAKDPDWVLINLGANHRHHSSREFRNQMDRLVDRVRLTHPDSRIVLMNFFRMRPDRLDTLETIKRLRNDSTIEVWDVRKALVGYTDKGVHPDRESHRQLSLLLAERIGAQRNPLPLSENGKRIQTP